MQRQQARRPAPPMAGAVDLEQLREPPEGAKKAMLDAARQKLMSGGLVCHCGERVTDRGIRAFGMWTGLIPVPGKGLAPVAQLGTVVFCSEECELFVAAKEDGIDFPIGDKMQKLSVLGYQANPEITWFKPRSMEGDESPAVADG
jgi:hypothetical protein